MKRFETILITGGMGFIGSHFVEHVHRTTDWNIIIVDKLSYASRGFERIRSMGLLSSPRIQVFTFDLSSSIPEGLVLEFGEVNYIVHMAADTHVDNSIDDPVPFIQNNVMSTVNLLEYARSVPTLKQFFYFSTDEVFGPALGDASYKEWDRHNPTNPYSASKSAAENICLSYKNTYSIPLVVVNVMNAFGERQHVEKFIPKCIDKILKDETVTIHANEDCTYPGSRFYIHARNIANAVLFLVKNGKVGEKYNITGERELDNLELAQMIAKELGKELKYEMVNFHANRPGHDIRYALDGSKLFDLGWKMPIDFEQSLKKTIQWTVEHPEWLKW